MPSALLATLAAFELPLVRFWARSVPDGGKCGAFNCQSDGVELGGFIDRSVEAARGVVAGSNLMNGPGVDFEGSRGDS